MKFNNSFMRDGNNISANEAIALGLKLAMDNGQRGAEATRRTQSYIKGIAEDVTIKQAPKSIEDLPTSKLADDVITTMEHSKVVNVFTPSLDVNPGEIAIDDNTDVANGHKANADKDIDDPTTETRLFFPKAIYKLTRLDHKTYLTQEQIVKFAVDRSSKAVIDGLAQAILVGGLKNEDGTTFDAVQPIVGDALATTSEIATGDAIAVASQMVKDFEDCPGENKVIFIASDTYKTIMAEALSNVALLQVVSADSPYTIIPTKLLNGKASYVILDPANYALGFQSKGVETLTDFVITQNSQYIEARLYVAGTLAVKGAAIVANVKTSA